MSWKRAFSGFRGVLRISYRDRDESSAQRTQGSTKQYSVCTCNNSVKVDQIAKTSKDQLSNLIRARLNLCGTFVPSLPFRPKASLCATS